MHQRQPQQQETGFDWSKAVPVMAPSAATVTPASVAGAPPTQSTQGPADTNYDWAKPVEISNKLRPDRTTNRCGGASGPERMGQVFYGLRKRRRHCSTSKCYRTRH